MTQKKKKLKANYQVWVQRLVPVWKPMQVLAEQESIGAF